MNIPAGTWVQIETVILPAGKRAPQVPEDTQATPLRMWVKGWLQDEATVGSEVTVQTVIGRVMSGKLVEIHPSYDHSYGAPIAALQQAGEQAKRLLASGVQEYEQ